MIEILQYLGVALVGMVAGGVLFYLAFIQAFANGFRR